jgi:hypothetical protein
MDDLTLTQLFARMDAHLARQDDHLARQDAQLQTVLETLARQNAMLVEQSRLLQTTAQEVAAMRRLPRRRAVAPRSSCPAACFECLMFADENRGNHQQKFLGDPAYRKFSGGCSWNPYLAAHTPGPIFLPCPGVACERHCGLARAGALWATGQRTNDQYSRYGMP